ncbi:MAG: hypothetical protein RIT14_903 [Pseudomonadota bacterium]
MSVRIHEAVAEFDRGDAPPALVPGLVPALAPVLGWRPVPRRARFYPALGKRVLDILFVLIAVPVVLPLVALLALLIAADGHSPVFRQERIGRGGQRFLLWKLRTMVPDAEDHLQRHLAQDAAARAEWDAFQKLSQDPRITRIGALLRKSSLDEIPQLWNVLKGDMSLVGPRPMMPEQRPLYPGEDYFALRPGVTGPWQVSDRNLATFAQRADFDSDYARRLSIGTDLKLILATVGVVLRCTGR